MEPICSEKVLKLIRLFRQREEQFEIITQRTPYYHMGATITDAILQAGLNYNNVVYPRVRKLLIQFPKYKTTCDFLILIQTIPLTSLIDWKNERKLNAITEMSWYLQNLGIQDENQLSIWLDHNDNSLSLLDIKGVGPKTLDYLKMLSGYQTVAIDRHLFGFLRMAGVLVSSYGEAKAIYTEAAKQLKMTEYEMDRKVWLLMSKLSFQRIQ